jgi:uncharacterized protein YdhG (YjbR/CyaY superfamily)
MKKSQIHTVDAYIKASALRAQPILRKIRRIARTNAPNAQELISYRIPALKQNGILVYYAAFKDHIGVYPPIKGDARMERAVARFRGPKGNLRFPLDQPFPYALFGRIVRLRAKQAAAKVRKSPR